MNQSVPIHRSHEKVNGYSLADASARFVDAGWPTDDARYDVKCPRCGAKPVEADELPCGCIEAFCTACTQAPRYFGFVVACQTCSCRRAVTR